MKALKFSETSITIYQSTRYNNPADMALQTVMLEAFSYYCKICLNGTKQTTKNLIKNGLQ
jgi:hypothetical protein